MLVLCQRYSIRHITSQIAVEDSPAGESFRALPCTGTLLLLYSRHIAALWPGIQAKLVEHRPRELWAYPARGVSGIIYYMPFVHRAWSPVISDGWLKGLPACAHRVYRQKRDRNVYIGQS